MSERPSSLRSYLVLYAMGANSYDAVGVYEAHSADGAIRQAVNARDEDDRNGVYLAAAKGSITTRDVTVKRVETLRIDFKGEA